ncbi:hypothetical protein, partial [Paenibacillus xylanexedens]|uniref:hypothetical protein n=1 Tax=Paenibacillus xylanexedens TaxID=528191 RepID=UPI001C92C123
MVVLELVVTTFGKMDNGSDMELIKGSEDWGCLLWLKKRFGYGWGRVRDRLRLKWVSIGGGWGWRSWWGWGFSGRRWWWRSRL